MNMTDRLYFRRFFSGVLGQISTGVSIILIPALTIVSGSLLNERPAHFLVDKHTVTIGKYCSLAENVHYFGANHPMDHVSTSAYFYNKALGLNVHDVKRCTLEIGNDVWIAYGTIITAGCKKIGNGAVIGAGSVVTKDVAPYAIVAGNPAKVLRMRFQKDLVAKLEMLKWWEKTPQQIYTYYPYMKHLVYCINDN